MLNIAQLASDRINIPIRSGCLVPEPTPKAVLMTTSLYSAHSCFQGMAETANCPLIPVLTSFLSNRTP